MRTLHTALRVSEPERSVAFHRALGYEVLGEVRPIEQVRLVMLSLPDDEFVSLELVHNPDHGPVDSSGLIHLVISVSSVQRTVTDLQTRGLKAEAPISHNDSGEFWTAWLHDPDGFRIELVQWPPDHPAGMTRADLQPQQASDH